MKKVLIGAIATLLLLVSGGTAEAAPYSSGQAGYICSSLASNPSEVEVTYLAVSLMSQNYTPKEAAEEFVYAVTYVCPQYMDLVKTAAGHMANV